MIKFIHVTDIHIMGRTPKYRKDDFLQTALKKISWVQEYAKSVGATAILCTGDLFDRADTAYSVLNDLMPVMQSSEVPWISIIGNHDEYGYNPDTIDRTPMGTLIKTGLIKYVSYDNPVIYNPDFSRKEGIVITGCDSTILTDNREDREYDYGIVDGTNYCSVLHADESVTTIHLSHGFLADKNWGEQIHHTQINEIYDKVKADIILCGHEHHGFGVITSRNGKIFINPGALGRITAGVGDVNREVNIAEITIDTKIDSYGEYKKEIDARLVSVAIAQNADDVIDIEKAMEEKERTQMLNNFSQTINAVNVDNVSMNPFEVIDAIANEVFESSELSSSLINQITIEAKKAIQDAHARVGGIL